MTIMNFLEYNNSQTKMANTNIKDDYILGDVIGHGGFSRVYEAYKMPRNERFAIKCYSKTVLKDKKHLVEEEINIMKKLQHPNIVQYFDCYESQLHYYLVLEYAVGGELFDRILYNGHYSEKDSSRLTLQILSAVNYLHSLNIVHRDLKPENLLCYGTEDDSKIMISDFGLAAIDKDSNLTGLNGSPNYLAPEIVNNERYGRAVDLWSIGVIVFTLLSGSLPFNASTKDKLFEKIKKVDFQFCSPQWDTISEHAKDFVQRLLQIDPKQRMTSKQAVLHRWHNKVAMVDILPIQESINAKWKRAVYATTAIYRMRTWSLSKKQPCNNTPTTDDPNDDSGIETLSQSPFSAMSKEGIRNVLSRISRFDNTSMKSDDSSSESNNVDQDSLSELGIADDFSMSESAISEEEDNSGDINAIGNSNLDHVYGPGLIAV